MFERPLKIDLTVPKSWNACTREQLETIASIILKHTAMATRYQPLDMYAVRVECFFALTGLEVQIGGNVDKETPLEKRHYLCRLHGSDEVFPLYLWQINSWVSTELKWLGDEKSQGLLNFVYPEYHVWHGLSKHVYDGPATLMQDFTWQRYRFAQDYMELYVLTSNKLVRMYQYKRQFTEKDLRLQTENVISARGKFLATIYNRKVKIKDPDTGKTEKAFQFVPSQPTDNYKDFQSFDPIRWQVILMWWSGMMQYLKHKYKRCFKRQAPEGSQPSTPLDLYTRTIATMEKYLGLDEDTVNKQNFHIVLQHMEDMAQQNEEYEKIKKK